jgi:bifunctional UDP-N-acetylglucosamine pyrophosphorylase/glucosamine-1-phosphate N-acetyltransferase
MLRRALLPLAKEIRAENAKGEYYLTDICTVARSRGIRVRGFHHPDDREVLGINTRRDLLEANRIMCKRICERHMEQGVTLLGESIYIEPDVRIGKDTRIFPCSYLRGATRVGERASIGPHVVIADAEIGDDVIVEPFCSLDGIVVKSGATAKPAWSASRLAADGAPVKTRVKQKQRAAGARRKP